MATKIYLVNISHTLPRRVIVTLGPDFGRTTLKPGQYVDLMRVATAETIVQSEELTRELSSGNSVIRVGTPTSANITDLSSLVSLLSSEEQAVLGGGGGSSSPDLLPESVNLYYESEDGDLDCAAGYDWVQVFPGTSVISEGLIIAHDGSTADPDLVFGIGADSVTPPTSVAGRLEPGESLSRDTFRINSSTLWLSAVPISDDPYDDAGISRVRVWIWGVA